MKLKHIFISTLFFLSTMPVWAQTEKESSDFLARLEHQIVAGFNIGGTSPLPIPAEIRSIDGFWPQFTPQLGYNVTYRIENCKLGLGTGIILDYKGMGTKASVKSMHTIINVQTSDGPGRFEGNFTGKNKTIVKSAYITVPLFLSYKFNHRWNVKLGGYASYLSSAKFSGDVSDGYIRVGDPTGERMEITEADFSFGDEMRNFDFGLMGGGEYSVNKRFGVFTNLSWGLTPIFKSSFTGLEYKMYNIYATFGLTYKL